MATTWIEVEERRQVSRSFFFFFDIFFFYRMLLLLTQLSLLLFLNIRLEAEVRAEINRGEGYSSSKGLLRGFFGSRQRIWFELDDKGQADRDPRGTVLNWGRGHGSSTRVDHLKGQRVERDTSSGQGSSKVHFVSFSSFA